MPTRNYADDGETYGEDAYGPSPLARNEQREAIAFAPPTQFDGNGESSDELPPAWDDAITVEAGQPMPEIEDVNEDDPRVEELTDAVTYETTPLYDVEQDGGLDDNPLNHEQRVRVEALKSARELLTERGPSAVFTRAPETLPPLEDLVKLTEYILNGLQHQHEHGPHAGFTGLDEDDLPEEEAAKLRLLRERITAAGYDDVCDVLAGPRGIAIGLHTDDPATVAALGKISEEVFNAPQADTGDDTGTGQYL